MAKWVRSSDGKRKRYVAVETTRKGRVVYNRKPHLFTINDVNRIDSRVLFDGEIPIENFQEVWNQILGNHLSLLLKAYGKTLALSLLNELITWVVRIALNFPQFSVKLEDYFGGKEQVSE